MKSFTSACMVALLLTLGLGWHASAQVTPPDESELPEGVVSQVARYYISGDYLQPDPDDVQVLAFTLFEMESSNVAAEFYDKTVDETAGDGSVEQSRVRLRSSTDDASLWIGEYEDGQPMTVLVLRDGKYFQFWIMIGNGDNEEVLADLYHDHFRGGYNNDTPFPDDSEVPDGMIPFGGD